jgi:hypothetical protein
MGFVVCLDGTNTTSANWHRVSGTVASAGTIAIPLAAKVGDLIIMMLATSSVPGTPCSAASPGGAWTVIDDKNATSSLAGRVTTFKYVMKAADVGASVTLTGGSAMSPMLHIVRSTLVAGGSLTVTVTTRETTVASASVGMPQITPVNVTDLRMMLIAGTGNPATYTYAETKRVENPAGAPVWLKPLGGESGNSSQDVDFYVCANKSDTDAGLTTWTAGVAGKFYVVGLAISEGVATDVPTLGSLVEFDTVLVPIPAAEADAPIVVPAYGGGIGVY